MDNEHCPHCHCVCSCSEALTKARSAYGRALSRHASAASDRCNAEARLRITHGEEAMMKVKLERKRAELEALKSQ